MLVSKILFLENEVMVDRGYLSELKRFQNPFLVFIHILLKCNPKSGEYEFSIRQIRNETAIKSTRQISQAVDWLNRRNYITCRVVRRGWRLVWVSNMAGVKGSKHAKNTNHQA
jgi:hypothetical protein